MTLDYRFGKAISPDDLLPLFAQTDWTDKRTPETIRAMLDNTSIILTVREGDRVIGFARVVTDDLLRAFIEDVIVDEAYRRQGIGAEIMRLLMERLAHVEEVILACEDHLLPFYGRFGFERFTMAHMHIWRGG